jgi:hypothetical protein
VSDSVAEWFGLREGHDNFFIEDQANADLLFARAELDKQIQSLLRRSFRNKLPPKFVLYGDWGVGKTHVMKHIMHWMDTRPEFAANYSYIEIPDVLSKSTFALAHSALMDALGMDRVKTWMFQYNAKHQINTFETIRRHTQSEDIARAFGALLTYGEANRLAWDWLRGSSLSAAEARNVGLPPGLDQSAQLVAVLRVLGMLSREVESKFLVLMIDEAARLLTVTKDEAIAHWLNAFRILADTGTREVGLIVSGSFADFDDIVPMLSDNQVVRRFGEEHYIALPRLQEADARVFTSALVSTWIEDEKRARLLLAHGAQADGESLDDSTFPFTSVGLDAFVEYACRDGGGATPAKIQQELDNFINRAMDDGRRILSRKYIDALVVEGGP